MRELDLNLTDLHARVAVNARVADLVALDAGIDVTVEKLESKLDDVDAHRA